MNFPKQPSKKKLRRMNKFASKATFAAQASVQLGKKEQEIIKQINGLDFLIQNQQHILQQKYNTLTKEEIDQKLQQAGSHLLQELQDTRQQISHHRLIAFNNRNKVLIHARNTQN